MNQEQRIARFKEAKLGLFIHWGLYSILGRGEWVMYRDRIPYSEYKNLVKDFSPQNFSPDSWCKAAKQAGMKYAVFTTCHHDGFALFNSKADPYNSVNSPAKRDFVAEFVASCKKYDLMIGLYYSLGDWRFGIMKESDSAEKSHRMKELSYLQIDELMSNYGKIDLLWYDGNWCYPSTPHDTNKEICKFWQPEKLNAMVRAKQPDILINDRSGTKEDFGTPEGHIQLPENGRAWEFCFTMSADSNSYWGYWDNNIYRKSAAQIVYLICNAVSRGGNVLINVSPDKNGVIPKWQKNNLNAIGKWIKENSEAVYCVTPSDLTTDINCRQGNSCGICAQKGNNLYFYMLEYPGSEVVIPIMKQGVRSVEILKDGTKLKHHTDNHNRLVIQGLPDKPINKFCSVLKIELDNTL